MTNFIELLTERNSYEVKGDTRELSKWIALLTKYNDNAPLPRELILKIETFFEYYWANNPLMAFKSQSDMRFLQELP